MKVLKAILLTGLAAVAMPALADNPPKPDRNAPNTVRCKQLTETGSLVVKKRICKTNAEWRAIREQQSQDADDLITRNRAGMNPNG
ncbi:hypothetical protein [Novosphingobium clariflavum]|uniref:Secreted protein n=1 Tax=Novosphingobium clariflavum TaxID=2029884 RepID=A0ABV6S8Y1_9SPHN|nr:hypothetical protein [Novosphingobium clariflavum]